MVVHLKTVFNHNKISIKLILVKIKLILLLLKRMSY